MKLQFSIKRLMVGMTLIAVGLGMCVYIFKPHMYGDPFPSESVCAAMWLMGGALMGAGVMTPLKHPIIGAAGGLLIHVLLMMWFLSVLAHGLGGI